MRLLIVGSDEIYSIENFYVKHLLDEGIEVECFTSQKYFYQYYQKSRFNKILYRAGVSNILRKINDRLKEKTESFRPDIMWVFKGMEVLPETLEWAKKKGIKLVNFNGDSPFLFSGRGSGNKNVTNAIPLYDLHFTYNSAVEREMQRRKFNVAILPFGYDLQESIYLECCEAKELLKACFLGNPDADRADFIHQLAKKGIAIDVYGNEWNQFIHHPLITIYKPVYGAECWKVLRKYRVQLNLMRPHNPDTHNMRSFELGGVGAIQLAPDTNDHRVYFKTGKEIFLYKDAEMCARQIKTILLMSKPDADRVRAAARARSIADGYSYQSRALHALEIMKQLLG